MNPKENNIVNGKWATIDIFPPHPTSPKERHPHPLSGPFLRKGRELRKNRFLPFIFFILLLCPSLLWGAEDEGADIQFNYATTYWDAGELYAARREYQKLVDLYPNSPLAPEALFRIGEGSVRLYDFNRAQRAYRRIISDFPDLDVVAIAHLRLGDFFRDSQDYTQARHHYLRILDNYSHTREAVVARIELMEIGEILTQEEGQPSQEEGDLPQSSPTVPDDGEGIGTGAR